MAKNQDYPLGLKWYKFYTSFYLPVFSFFFGLALFGDISALFVQKSYSYYPLSELYTFVFFGLIFELITFCFQIAALIRLRRDDEKSFATNNAYLIFLCIFSAYKAALFQVRFDKYSSFSDRVVIDTSSVIPAFIITFLLVFFVWFLPNFYYFKKRLDYLCGTYIRPPSQDILSMFDEIKENPQAIKEKARELHSAGKVDLYEYQYIIINYVDCLNGDTTVATVSPAEDHKENNASSVNGEVNADKKESQFDKDIDAHPVLSYILLGFGPILWLAAISMLFSKGNTDLGALLLIVVPIIVVLWFCRNRIKAFFSNTDRTQNLPQKQTFCKDNAPPVTISPASQTPAPVKTCFTCGAPLIDGAAFCNKCGRKLGRKN